MTEPVSCSVEIAAPPARVFGYFTKPEALVEWIGDYAVLDARPGGEFTLDIRGIPVRGEFVEVTEYSRIIVSWGHAGSAAMPPGSTEVEFGFEPTDVGTLVSVEHRNLPPDNTESHKAGWPMFLSRLEAVVG